MSPMVSSVGSLSAKSVGLSNGIKYISLNGEKYSDTTYNYIVYKTAGTFTNDFIVFTNIDVDILVIGGGGAPGFAWQTATFFANTGNDMTAGPFGGGGGSGGVIYNNSISITAPSVTLTTGKYSITVGAGASIDGQNGGNSRFGTQTIAIGGGAGSGSSFSLNGATAGGGSSVNTLNGKRDPTLFQGGNGGVGTTVNGGGGGGGGGATNSGAAAVSNGGSGVLGGKGGAGLVTFGSWSTILGYQDPNIYPDYALAMGGGGGTVSSNLNPSASPGTGGITPGSGGSAAYRDAIGPGHARAATPGYDGIVMIRILK